MSKMPAKKKSCFQITSVTQAQVAAIGAADDTESLDDPDESRAEDVSSEIYDMSRAEYEPASDRSPSEEALNNVGEVEAPAHIPQTSQLSNKVSNQSGQQQTGLSAGLPLTSQQQAAAVSVNTSQTVSSFAPPAAASSTVSCTSRFRVIKLDHGTGEPFRRGRWTCTEFYDKESEGSVGKPGDNIRHASTTLDPTADRDSGLGHTVGSGVDTSVSSTRIISVETLPAGYNVRQQGLSGTQNAFSNSKSTAVQPQQPSAGVLQPPAPQGVLPVGQNGLPQPGVHIQKSPVMPPSYTAQQQLPMGHHLTSQAPVLGQSQTEYYQPTGQSLLSAAQGPSSSQPGASGVVPVPSQVGDVVIPLLTGPPPVAVLQQHTVPSSLLVSGSTLQSQYIPVGQSQPHNATSSSVQNVPANAVSSSVPGTLPAALPSASSAVMPNATSSSLPPALFKAPVVQGVLAGGLGQVEGVSGRKSEGLVGAQSSHVPGKEMVKPLMPETLQLSAPAVNSLFGIHIPVDGDEDSASGTNVVAIDNKIEQAMDLVKSHLMYAVREEVEVLKEQIKELYERNSVLERENAVLKSLANTEQLSQLSAQAATSSSSTPPQPAPSQPQPLPPLQHHASTAPTAPIPQQLQTQLDPNQQLQPNVTSA